MQVVDNHCHSVERQQGQLDVAAWRSLFSESPDPRMRTVDVADSIYYRRLMGELATLYEVERDESAVLEARASTDAAGLTARLFRDARIGAVVVDTGFPDPRTALTVAEIGSAAGCQAVGLLRLELVFQELVATCATYDALVDAVRDRLAGAREQGFAGFKSIVGYRTGLDVQQWPAEDAVASFLAARRAVDATGTVRLGHKPLLDTLLHVAFEIATAEGLPVQFHVGYGDPDADLRRADPLLLRDVLEERRYRGMPVVLLHGCWPFFREGAFLAAVYGNAHLDLSYGIPFLSRREMKAVTRAALGAAPTSKLMYSSDGSRVPELHWLSALDGRRLLAEALDELVTDGDLTGPEARRAGEQILRDNARVLYGLGGGS